MKSRRQSSGGSSAGATAAGEGNTHSSGGGCKLERKDVEKNRRLHMKGLCLKLSSLIPPAARRASLLSEAAASASNPNKVTLLCRLDSSPSLSRSGPSEPVDFRSNGVLGSSRNTACTTPVSLPDLELASCLSSASVYPASIQLCQN